MKTASKKSVKCLFLAGLILLWLLATFFGIMGFQEEQSQRIGYPDPDVEYDNMRIRFNNSELNGIIANSSENNTIFRAYFNNDLNATMKQIKGINGTNGINWEPQDSAYFTITYNNPNISGFAKKQISDKLSKQLNLKWYTQSVEHTYIEHTHK